MAGIALGVLSGDTGIPHLIEAVIGIPYDAAGAHAFIIPSPRGTLSQYRICAIFCP